MKLDPSKTDGSCIADEPGHSSATFGFDHAPSIMSTDAVVGDGSVGGTLKFHAPDAWTDHVVTSEWLGGSSTDQWASSAVPPLEDDNYEAGFSGGAANSSRMLLLKVLACGDQEATTVIAGVDNGCGDQSGGGNSQSCKLSDTGPAPCVGRPIKLFSRNMQMTERDPLPAMEWFSLVRTYNSRGTVAGQTVPGFFGNGWASFFDAHLFTYHPQSLSKTVVEIRTASDAGYVFEDDGQWVQLWPKGSKPAILTESSGLFTLREPGSSIETVFDGASGMAIRSHSRSFPGRDVSVSYSSGFPVHVADSWWNSSWTITPNAANRISSIAIDGTSLVWTYTYDGSGNLITVTGPSSSLWRTYAYNGTKLTQAHDARGSLIESHSYTDDLTHATSSIADQDDITSIITLAGRDNFEKITRTTSGNGSTTDYYTRVIAGRQRTVQIIGHCATCGTNDAVYAYDFANGHLLREQDSRGYITAYGFDAADRVVSISGPYQPSGCDPATDSNHCRQTPSSLFDAVLVATPVAATTAYTYGDVNWPDVATVTTTASVLVPNQVRTTTVVLDPLTGTVTQQVTAGGTGTPAQLVQYTTSTSLYNGTEGAAFNPGGSFDSAWLSLVQPRLRKTSDGPRTDVTDTTDWVYYPLDSAVPAPWRGRRAAIRNAAGHITRFENYDVFGNAARVIDPNGVVTEYTFDEIGRVLTSTLKAVAGCDTSLDPLCATDIVTSRSYNPALGPLASTTTPRGGATTYEYDDRGRTAATTRQVTATAYERIEYDYDSATGRKSAERYLGGHPGAWTVTRSDAFQYDSFARLREIDHPDGSKIVYHYDGANNLASVQDERHSTDNTIYAYDPLNRLASVTQTLSTAPGGQISTAYGYDLHGNLTSVTDPNGNVTSYIYDDFGRMIQQTSPVTGTTLYDYDAAGNLSSTTVANGTTTARTYDPLSRVLTTLSANTTASEQVTWSYDDATADAYGIGRLASMSSDDSSTAFRYERRGRLREEDVSIEGDPFVQSYGYDADGNRASVTYASGRLVTYAFDYAGRPVSVTGSMSGTTTPYVTTASYLPFGPLTSLGFGNGTAETRTFDQKYSPATAQLSAGGGLLANYSYAADAAGNITQINDLTDAGYNRMFGYDDLNRLVTANSGSSMWGTGGYTYDAMGNMLTSTLGTNTRSFSYVGATPLINTVSAGGALTQMQYDAAGNELNGPAAANTNFISDTRTYSPRNLLQQADLTGRHCFGGEGPETCTGGWGQSTTTFWNGYDARGVRAASMQSSSIGGFPDMKYYFYTPELMQLATFSPNEGVESDVIWFGGRPVASDTTGASSPSFTFTDHLGTPILQMDALANVVWRAEYEPFGNITAMRAGGANDQRLRFPGQQVAFTNFAGDEENYNIFRWYRSSWGRYTQADPLLRRLADLDSYAYAQNNPVNAMDPVGLITLKRSEIRHSLGWSPNGGGLTIAKGLHVDWSCTSKDCVWKLNFVASEEYEIWAKDAATMIHEEGHVNIDWNNNMRLLSHLLPAEHRRYKSKAECDSAAAAALVDARQYLTAPPGQFWHDMKDFFKIW